MDDAEAAAGTRALRVATFNIHHGADAANTLDLERTAQVIGRLAGDVAFLQEVDRHWLRSGGVDQAVWLADRLGMHSAFGPALSLGPEVHDGPSREYGQLILSRYPLTEVRTLPLPGDDATEPRILLAAHVDVAGRGITVAGVHLENTDAGVRTRQARTVLAALARSGEPVVLAGDFNDEEGGPALRILAGHLTNAWDVRGEGDGWTFTGDDGRPARIDHVLTAGLRCARAWVHDGSPRASDHLPLVADVEW